MMTRPRQPSAAGPSTEEQIRAAAIELFAERGFAATSMRDIARAARLSLSGLYHHFSGKEDLLFRIERDAYERLMAPLRDLPDGGSPAETIARIIHNHVAFFAGQITEMKVLSHEMTALGGERGRRIRRMRREYFELCQKAVAGLLGKTGRRRVNARAQTMCLFGMINWIYTWYIPQRDGDPAVLADMITRIFLNGLPSIQGAAVSKRVSRKRRRISQRTR